DVGCCPFAVSGGRSQSLNRICCACPVKFALWNRPRLQTDDKMLSRTDGGRHGKLTFAVNGFCFGFGKKVNSISAKGGNPSMVLSRSRGGGLGAGRNWRKRSLPY